MRTRLVRSSPMMCLLLLVAAAMTLASFGHGVPHEFPVSRGHVVEVSVDLHDHDDQQVTNASQADHGHRHAKHNPADHSHDVPAILSAAAGTQQRELSLRWTVKDHASPNRMSILLERPPRA